jgi:hypothetical protein
MGFERQSVGESTSGRALANWNGGVAMVERGTRASRRVRGPGRSKARRLGRHTNVSTCGSTSEEPW